MNHQEIIEKIKPELQSLAESFKEGLMEVRTSHLSPAIIENVEVEIEGTKMPLKSLGAISAQSLRELSVQPWDKSYVKPIIKAIESSNLGLTPVLDKETIRLSAPPLSGEHRANLIRLLNQKLNDALQAIRRVRDKAWKGIQEGYQKGEIKEDDKYKGKDELEEVVREYRGKIEEMAENKKQEIEG